MLAEFCRRSTGIPAAVVRDAAGEGGLLQLEIVSPEASLGVEEKGKAAARSFRMKNTTRYLPAAVCP